MDYRDKYIKYKLKYLNLKEKSNLFSKEPKKENVFSRASKNISIKMSFEIPNCEKIHNNYDYPIQSFLKGDGQWTYTDVDSTYINIDKHNYYDYLKPINYECHPDNNECHVNDKHAPHSDYENYKPIHPRNLLNIDSWDKIYYYQEGENEFQEWIIIFKSNDKYVYFKASCDYTGFDCQGGGDISFSTNKNKFWNYCLDQYARLLLLKKNGYEMKITFN